MGDTNQKPRSLMKDWQPQKIEGPLRQIFLRTYEVANIPGFGMAHYNELCFRDKAAGIGNDLCINGAAWDRTTGQFLGIPRSDQDTMRVVLLPIKQGTKIYPDSKDIATTMLWQGDSYVEYLQYSAKAGEAARFINSQNLAFTTFERRPQNPNSVTATIVKAMGLFIPGEVENLWAPGSERLLAPKNFKTNVKNLLSGVDSIEHLGVLEKYRTNLFVSLLPQNIQKDILAEQKSGVSKTPAYFNPDQPLPFILPQLPALESVKNLDGMYVNPPAGVKPK